jgi:hypothetical protein
VVALRHSVIAGSGERKAEQVMVVLNGGTTKPAGAKGLYSRVRDTTGRAAGLL